MHHRMLVVHNDQKESLGIKFMRPDVGFSGSHIRIKEEITLQPKEWVLTSIGISKNKPYSSIMCITPTKKFILRVPEDVSEISIKNDSNSDT